MWKICFLAIFCDNLWNKKIWAFFVTICGKLFCRPPCCFFLPCAENLFGYSGSCCFMTNLRKHERIFVRTCYDSGFVVFTPWNPIKNPRALNWAVKTLKPLSKAVSPHVNPAPPPAKNVKLQSKTIKPLLKTLKPRLKTRAKKQIHLAFMF